MMIVPRVVWKYELPDVNTKIHIPMPFGARVIHVDVQDRNRLYIWAIIDPEEMDMDDRVFWVAETGARFDLHDIAGHVGTVLMFDGSYVAHIFELIVIE